MVIFMNELTLMDCTLRDGANVVGTGYSAELTKMIIEGLIRSNIRVIEMGNAYGIGANETASKKAPLTDEEYLQLVQPYLPQAEIGMFMGVKNANEKNIALAAKYGLKFLRMGANAGDGWEQRESSVDGSYLLFGSSEKTVKKTESKETQTLKKVLAAPESQANPGQVAAKRRSIRLNGSRCRQRTSTMIRITRRSSTAFFNRGKINEKKAGNYGCDFACDMRTVRLRRQR